MLGKIVAVCVAAAAMAAVVPAAASASTAVPALHATDTQAYLLDSSGSPITSSTTLVVSGTITFDTAASFTCDASFTITVNPDGTTAVKAPSSFANCTINIQSCSYSMAPLLDMGDRLVLDSSGDFRDRINFSSTTTFSGAGCPFGPVFFRGELSPILTFDGSGALEMTFDGAAAGTIASGFGPAIATGTFTEQGTLGNYGLGI